jgi:hypothetical protein
MAAVCVGGGGGEGGWYRHREVARGAARVVGLQTDTVQTARRLRVRGRPKTLKELECKSVTQIRKKQVRFQAHFNQVRKRTAQILGMLGPLLNRRSGLSVSNGLLLYKQPIRPMMQCVCPVWRSAARSNVRKLQVPSHCCQRTLVRW